MLARLPEAAVIQHKKSVSKPVFHSCSCPVPGRLVTFGWPTLKERVARKQTKRECRDADWFMRRDKQ